MNAHKVFGMVLAALLVAGSAAAGEPRLGEDVAADFDQTIELQPTAYGESMGTLGLAMVVRKGTAELFGVRVLSHHQDGTVLVVEVEKENRTIVAGSMECFLGSAALELERNGPTLRMGGVFPVDSVQGVVVRDTKGVLARGKFGKF